MASRKRVSAAASAAAAGPVLVQTPVATASGEPPFARSKRVRAGSALDISVADVQKRTRRRTAAASAAAAPSVPAAKSGGASASSAAASGASGASGAASARTRRQRKKAAAPAAAASSPAAGAAGSAEPLQCNICFEAIKTRGELDSCKHDFCFACIDTWSKSSNTCPLCKRRFAKLTEIKGTRRCKSKAVATKSLGQDHSALFSRIIFGMEGVPAEALFHMLVAQGPGFDPMNVLRAAFVSHYDEDDDEDYEDDGDDDHHEGYGYYDHAEDEESSSDASVDASCTCIQCMSARGFYDDDADVAQCPGCGMHSTFFGTDTCTACGFLKVFRVQPGAAGSSAANPVELLSDDDDDE